MLKLGQETEAWAALLLFRKAAMRELELTAAVIDAAREALRKHDLAQAPA